MPHKTQRDQSEDNPCWDDWCEETMLLRFLQLNSVVMSGGIYLYDKFKSKLFFFFFSFQKETG